MKMCFDKQTVKTCGTVIFENDNNLTTTILNKEQKRSSDKKNPLAALNTALKPPKFKKIVLLLQGPIKKNTLNANNYFLQIIIADEKILIMHYTNFKAQNF